VLFSLGNLAQLASDSRAPRRSAVARRRRPTRGAAHAGGEGSGLIDIRSMASAYLGDRAKSATAPSSWDPIGSVDDLPVFSSGASPSRR
jgi:hypothetical protein